MNKEEEQEREPNGLSLDLGDIIELIAPTNDQLHQSTFYITYIDNSKIKVTNVATLEKVQLNIDEQTGKLSDQSIVEIHLLSRSEELGYARQNGLLTGTWIEIYFSSEVNTIITGEITSLDEDQIEITTVPDLKKIYIDFAYQGIPEHIPITHIKIREKPQSIKDLTTISEEDIESPYKSSREPSIEISDEGEVIIHADEDADVEENILYVLQNLVTKSKGLVIEDDVEEFVRYVELSDNQKRYGIDIQLNSILDEILSTIPKANRSPQIMSKIHILIERYKELRELFSLFDENGNIRKYKTLDENLHKPLVEHMKKMDQNFKWILPISTIKKKIYTVGDEENQDDTIQGDITIESFESVLQLEEQIKSETYYKNSSDNGQNKLYNMYKQLGDLMTPFENPRENLATIQAAVTIKTGIESIIDNLDDFYSTVSKTGALLKRRFVTQKYSLGLDKLEDRNETVVRTQLTNPDTIAIKSFMTLPMQVTQYSKVDLPGTALIDRIPYHQSCFSIFRLLKKRTEIVPYVIEDLSKELDYEQMEAESKEQFLDRIAEYSLDPSLIDQENPEIFNKFLQTFIPKTQVLIRLLRKHLSKRLSFVSLVQELEPFAIYPQDITFKQYSEIRRFIMEKIDDLKTEIEEKRKEFSFMTNTRFALQMETMPILKLLLEDKDIMSNFFLGYKLPEKEVLESSFTSQEILDRLMQYDQGILLSKLIASIMSPLMTPDSLLIDDKETVIDDMTESQKAINEDCHRYIITKKYSSVADLQKDNGSSEIYYDKEFDTSPYHILDKYKKEKKEKLAEDFVGYFAENLVQKHDCPRDRSLSLAKQLMEGKRLVKEGEYAILELKPKLINSIDESSLSSKEKEELEKEAITRAKKQYYIRKKDHWVHQPDAGDEEFMPTEDIICQIDKRCYRTSSPLVTGEKCESNDAAALRMREIVKSRALKEFDRRYEESAEDHKVNLENRIIQQIRFMYRFQRLSEAKNEKPNNYAYELGLLYSNPEELVVSPYLNLRDLILGQTDFKKKQFDIMRIYHQFCREPLEQLDEKVSWKYCKETNTPLLPGFFVELAQCFISGGDYEYKLAETCHKYGLLSDSGDAIVDKNSGFMIRKIAFSDEEGYNEAGFKITTRAFIEKDQADAVRDSLLSTTVDIHVEDSRICESEDAQHICRILEAIQRNLELDIRSVKDFIVRVAFDISRKTIKPEAEYNKFAQEIKEKKGIKVLSYEKRRDQLIIFITTAILFIAVQTEIPSFIIKKTMPGCVRSFVGYPLSGEEDMSGLKYMACVLDKMKAGWDSIKKMNATVLYDELKKLIDSAILKHPEVDERYILKREYLERIPDQAIPESHAVEAWKTFYPPLFDIDCIKSLSSIGSGFKDEYISLMKKGNSEQQKDFLVLKTKIQQYSYAIIEAIQKIVKGKQGILRTITSDKPYLQNACCNELDKPYNPLRYFIEEDDMIRQYTKTVKSLALLINHTIDIAKPAILYDRSKTGLKYSMIDSFSVNSVFEQNIYAAFIHYCGLDKGLPIPVQFHSFFAEIPKGWNKGWSLLEKMEFLKKSDKKFSKEQLDHLMTMIANKNSVEIVKRDRVDMVKMMKDMINFFEQNDSHIMEGPLREHLLGVIGTYDATKLITFLTEDDTAGSNERVEKAKVLKNYLNRVNTQFLKPEIIAFLKSYGLLEKRAFDKIVGFLNTIVKKWNIENQISSIATFMKNVIQDITVGFPNIILNNIQNNRIHKYWGLSENDERVLYNFNKMYYDPLKPFFSDRILQRVLREIELKCVDLRMFFNTLPIYSPIQRGEHEYFALFDRDMIVFLIEYIFYSVIHEYIITANDDEYILFDRNEKKMDRRQAIKEKGDLSIQFETVLGEIDESIIERSGELAEVQIEMGNKQELQERVAALIITFLTIIQDNKDDIDISYEMIATSIRKKKEAEKLRFTERLRLLSPDERKIEDQKKKFKLDEWNVGMQTGLFKYNKNTSDRERREQELEEQLEIAKYGMRSTDYESIYNGEEEVELEGQEIEQLEEADEDELERVDRLENQDGGIDISGLQRNWMDGGYYSEDGSDDDFGDGDF